MVFIIFGNTENLTETTKKFFIENVLSNFNRKNVLKLTVILN